MEKKGAMNQARWRTGVGRVGFFEKFLRITENLLKLLRMLTITRLSSLDKTGNLLEH